MHISKSSMNRVYFCFGMGFVIFFMVFSIHQPIANCAEFQFVDKTIDAGLSHPLSASFGLSWGDFDQDGWMDLYIRNHAQKPSLYRNLGDGSFKDITSSSGIVLSEDFHGASWGDFDNDGDMDLYQAVGSPGTAKMNFLYRTENESGSFTEIAEFSGVTDPDGRGRTPVWVDYDRDGFLDLLICNLTGGDSFSKIYHNNGDGTFTDTMVRFGSAFGTALGDYDNDGDLDVLILSARPTLVQNNGNGDFQDVTLIAGLGEIDKVSNAAAGDYDNDNDLDLYIVRRNDGDDAYLLDTDTLKYTLRLSNHSEKGFDITAVLPILTFDIYRYGSREKPKYIFIGSNSKNPDAVPFSLDSDSESTHGRPSYVAGVDNGTFIWFEPSSNRWQIRHSVGPLSAGLGVVVSAPDALADALPIELEIDTSPVPNQLFQNQGDGTFINVTQQAGVGDLRQGQAAVWSDFDNDGDLELYVVNSGKILNEPNVLYENLGDGTFVDVASESGSLALTQGRGESVAVADYNNDGFTDLLLLNGYGLAPFSNGPRVLLHNEGIANHWLQIKLVGRISNRDGIGAKVNLKAGALMLARQQTGGMHRFSQNSQILQFGLASRTSVDDIFVHWPSGMGQRISNIATNQRLAIEEPEPVINLTLSTDTFKVPRGGILEVRVTATNLTGQYQGFLLGTNVSLPNGDMYPFPPDFLFGPRWVRLAPYQTISRVLTHTIPSDAPLGIYIYNGAAGKKPWRVWYEDHFKFAIIRSS